MYSDISLNGQSFYSYMPLPGMLERKKPKSMWKILPVLCSKMLPLWRSLACRKYMTKL